MKYSIVTALIYCQILIFLISVSRMFYNVCMCYENCSVFVQNVMIGWYTLISYQWRLTAQKIEFNEDSGVGIISGWIRYSVSAVLMSAECEGQNQFCDNTAPAAPAPFYPPPANLSPTGALHNSINLSRFLWLGSQYSTAWKLWMPWQSL